MFKFLKNSLIAVSLTTLFTVSAFGMETNAKRELSEFASSVFNLATATVHAIKAEGQTEKGQATTTTRSTTSTTSSDTVGTTAKAAKDATEVEQKYFLDVSDAVKQRVLFSMQLHNVQLASRMEKVIKRYLDCFKTQDQKTLADENIPFHAHLAAQILKDRGQKDFTTDILAAHRTYLKMVNTQYATVDQLIESINRKNLIPCYTSEILHGIPIVQNLRELQALSADVQPKAAFKMLNVAFAKYQEALQLHAKATISIKQLNELLNLLVDFYYAQRLFIELDDHEHNPYMLGQASPLQLKNCLGHHYTLHQLHRKDSIAEKDFASFAYCVAFSNYDNENKAPQKQSKLQGPAKVKETTTPSAASVGTTAKVKKDAQDHTKTPKDNQQKETKAKNPPYVLDLTEEEQEESLKISAQENQIFRDSGIKTVQSYIAATQKGDLKALEDDEYLAVNAIIIELNLRKQKDVSKEFDEALKRHVKLMPTKYKSVDDLTKDLKDKFHAKLYGDIRLLNVPLIKNVFDLHKLPEKERPLAAYKLLKYNFDAYEKDIQQLNGFVTLEKLNYVAESCIRFYYSQRLFLDLNNHRTVPYVVLTASPANRDDCLSHHHLIDTLYRTETSRTPITEAHFTYLPYYRAYQRLQKEYAELPAQLAQHKKEAEDRLKQLAIKREEENKERQEREKATRDAAEKKKKDKEAAALAEAKSLAEAAKKAADNAALKAEADKKAAEDRQKGKDAAKERKKQKQKKKRDDRLARSAAKAAAEKKKKDEEDKRAQDIENSKTTHAASQAIPTQLITSKDLISQQEHTQESGINRADSDSDDDVRTDRGRELMKQLGLS